MTDGDPCARHQAPDPRSGGLDGLDPVVDVENLTAAIELAINRVAHQTVVVLRDPRLDGEASLGWGLDHGQVPDPHQR